MCQVMYTDTVLAIWTLSVIRRYMHVHVHVTQFYTYDMYMEIHVLSTIAYENMKEKKGNPPNHDLDKQTYIARDTWMPSLENWGGGLKIFCVASQLSPLIHIYIHMYHVCSGLARSV